MAPAAVGLRRAGGRFLLAREIRSSGAGANVHFLARGFGARGGVTMPRALLEDPAPAPAMDATATTTGRGSPPSASVSAAASRITPAVLFVTVVLAVVLLVSGLLHVLRRVFLKSHHASAGAGERQLQHLFFPAHDDGGAGGSGTGGGGLGQAAIDALPEFAYAELSGTAAAAAASRKGKEKAARPFDCAVCLCEFADHDRLRLLPLCGHAFHVACIDVWLRSSATCPLCRTKVSARHLAAATDAPSSVATDVEEQKPQQDQAPPDAVEAASSSVVLPVRLGRFKNVDDDAESSSSTGATSRIDRRRCYSMGSYQYVLADEHLLVSVHLRHGNAGGGAGTACGTSSSAAVTAASSSDEQHQGKKVFARGDSFSVSKIWQWRGSKRLPGGLCADDGLPWAPAAKDDHASANTRQHSDT
ncbi:hypothetical protein BDA96_02G199100 [Sorghum bicolor]|uniref:RING-type domain-containing protein n=1 Tax=Sorghum bicolor TaxID=4558 RepID=A0A921RPK4_SORBI|nr:hypothetical protein BDA96_02G199100 [Sorghum bicolor]